MNIVKGHSMELNMIKHKNFALTTMIGLQQSLIKHWKREEVGTNVEIVFLIVYDFIYVI